MQTEQALLFAVTILALVTTLIFTVLQYRRMYGKRKDDDPPRDDEPNR